jgi:hypothetical protein
MADTQRERDRSPATRNAAITELNASNGLCGLKHLATGRTSSTSARHPGWCCPTTVERQPPGSDRRPSKAPSLAAARGLPLEFRGGTLMTRTAEPAPQANPVDIEPTPIVAHPFAATPRVKGSQLLKLLHTTDHKLIGRMYLVTSFVFFMLGGVMALLMRAELARPGMQFLSPEQYNRLFTMHGTIMLLFFATPLVFAFANLVLPLQIGAPDVAFPG